MGKYFESAHFEINSQCSIPLILLRRHEAAAVTSLGGIYQYPLKEEEGILNF
jgi:hypothetical protein